jgi:hypothetical protein
MTCEYHADASKAMMIFSILRGPHEQLVHSHHAQEPSAAPGPRLPAHTALNQSRVAVPRLVATRTVALRTAAPTRFRHAAASAICLYNMPDITGPEKTAAIEYHTTKVDHTMDDHVRGIIGIIWPNLMPYECHGLSLGAARHLCGRRR